MLSRNLFASCYEANNMFNIDGDIKGLVVNFSQELCAPGGSGSPAPYKILVPRDSNLKQSSSIKFTITDNDLALITNDKKIIRFYGLDGLIAEISKNDLDQQTWLGGVNIEKEGQTYILSNIDFLGTRKISFGDTGFIGSIDDVRYRTDDVSDFVPFVVSNPYHINSSNNRSLVPLFGKSATLPNSIMLKSTIYYDHEKSSVIKGDLNCKEDYIKSDDLGYYFEKTLDKDLKISGCCYKETVKQGFANNNIKTNVDIDFSEDKIGRDNAFNLSDLECVYGSVSANLSYYFDDSSCEIRFLGQCSGDGIVPDSSLINDCSLITAGDTILKTNGADYTIEIGCKVGCKHSNINDTLKYLLSSSTAEVTISGEKCVKKTQTIESWTSEVPKGINKNTNIEYKFNEDRLSLDCMSGYISGAVEYYFSDESENINFIGSCAPKEYKLSDYNNFESLEGLSGDISVSYNEDINSIETKSPLGCIPGYESDGDLGYYFTDIDTDGRQDLVIYGGCNRKQYMLNNYENFDILITIDGSISVTYDENKHSIASMGSLSCNANYRSDGDLGYYFTDTNANGEQDLVISGNCMLDDYNSVLADHDALIFDIIKQGNSNMNNILTPLTLPALGSNGTNISWSSSDNNIEDESGGIREGDGVVIRPNPGVATNNVTLYANISKGNESMQKSFALQVAPYNEYSRYVGYGSYQYNGWGWDSTKYYSSEWKNTYTDCATSCKNDRYCMFAFWRHSSGKMCKKFNNVDNKDYGYQTYNDNLRYYKY